MDGRRRLCLEVTARPHRAARDRDPRNAAWMKENSIVPTGKPVESTVDFHGMKGELLHFEARDENGPTNVDFVFAGHARVFMFTLWASDEEMKNHADDSGGILESIKPMR